MSTFYFLHFIKNFRGEKRLGCEGIERVNTRGMVLLDFDHPRRFHLIRRGKSVVRSEGSPAKSHPMGGKVLFDYNQPKGFHHIRRGKSVVRSEGSWATSHPILGKVLLDYDQPGYSSEA